MSLYEILEIKQNASEQEIKKAYHLLSRKYHPDKCSDINATEKFQQISSAYQLLMDDTIRKKYIKMNYTEKSNFQILLEKIFSSNLKIQELKNLGINFSTVDWKYLEINYKHIFQAINFKELFEMFLSGKVPIKKENYICSDSDTNSWDETQAEYYYDLPFEFQKPNKLDIIIKKNISLNDLIEKNKGETKIKRRFEDEECTTKYIYNIKTPYIVFNNGGDMEDGDYGNLIIELILPTNFYWKENLIIYEHLFTGYQMFYGIDIKLNIGDNKQIEYINWVPSRDGLIINVQSINIKNHCFTIKLTLNYEHNDEKEEILRYIFN